MIRREWMATLAAYALLAAGSAGFYADRTVGAAHPPAWAAPGYQFRQVADQLTAPVGVAVGARGEIYLAESGASGSPARILKWTGGKQRSTLAADFPAPLTGVTWHAGKLYVAYAGGMDVLDPATGLHHPVLSNLPAAGDYTNGAAAIGPDGYLYFGVGTATNSGVVGEDNLKRGWVKAAPKVRDIPCREVTVRGSNFSIANPLTTDPLDMATTGAFSSFGTTTARLQLIPGAVPCTGSVLRANLDGTGLEMFAWGLRNPAGVAFGPDGQLYATMEGFEDRGSRPIVNDRDYLYRIEKDRWYGWPDFAGGRSVTEEEFQKPSFPVTPLLTNPPEQPPTPITTFSPRSGVAGIIFPSAAFSLRGDALVALSGDAGGLIVRVNPRTGAVTPFAHRKTPGSTPVFFATAPDGAVYMVDRGQSRMTAGGPEAVPGTGSLWRITPGSPPGSSRSGAVKWQWALVGMVMSLAGIHLVSTKT